MYQNWQWRSECQPALFLGRELPALMRASRTALGKYLNAEADDLVYIPNATHGINIIARSLALKLGDEVLTTDHEYGARDYTWDFNCGRTGARYIHQSIPLPVHTEVEIVEQFWEGVTPQTKVIYFSQITSSTALRLPVDKICQRARQLGILTIIDAPHSPIQIPVGLSGLREFEQGDSLATSARAGYPRYVAEIASPQWMAQCDQLAMTRVRLHLNN